MVRVVLMGKQNLNLSSLHTNLSREEFVFMYGNRLILQRSMKQTFVATFSYFSKNTYLQSFLVYMNFKRLKL